MKKRQTILFLIPHLGGGGAEQVTALLLRNLCPQKYDLHLGLITQREIHPESLPSHVSVHGLGSARVRDAVCPLLALVWRLNPDVIVSGMVHLNLMVLMLRIFFPRNTRVMVRQNSTISAALSFGGLPRYSAALIRRFYPRADRIVCQTDAMALDVSALLRLEHSQVSRLMLVAPNPVDVDAIRAAVHRGNPSVISARRGPGPHLLAVGRLAREKGFDLLLRALLLVRERVPHADLAIVGAGPEEQALKRLSRDLHLDSVTCFTGHVESPAAFFADTTALVLCSHHEGLPNALLEAAAGGLPLVVTPCCSGLVELVTGQPGVWLAEAITAESLAAAILAALHALESGQRFPHPFVEPFTLARSIAAYEALIDAMHLPAAVEPRP
jgi:glycosyltransferase involved in cell wall biosynthesis